MQMINPATTNQRTSIGCGSLVLGFIGLMICFLGIVIDPEKTSLSRFCVQAMVFPLVVWLGFG
jgi:hypothetical protein